jgi:hypothetical protein
MRGPTVPLLERQLVGPARLKVAARSLHIRRWRSSHRERQTLVDVAVDPGIGAGEALTVGPLPAADVDRAGGIRNSQPLQDLLCLSRRHACLVEQP